MDIVTKAKYLLCGLSVLIDEKTLNIIICDSQERTRFEKKQYEDLIKNKIRFFGYNKTIFKNGGEIIWKSAGILRGYSAPIVILIGLDKNSKEYKDLESCVNYGTKIYTL